MLIIISDAQCSWSMHQFIIVTFVIIITSTILTGLSISSRDIPIAVDVFGPLMVRVPMNMLLIRARAAWPNNFPVIAILAALVAVHSFKLAYLWVLNTIAIAPSALKRFKIKCLNALTQKHYLVLTPNLTAIYHQLLLLLCFASLLLILYVLTHFHFSCLYFEHCLLLSYVFSVRPGPRRLIELTTSSINKCLSSVAGPET